jgi:two-component system sensor histidine kinase BaeS
MVALVGLVAVVLVIAGAGSLVLTRNAERHQATQQLITEAQSLTSGAHTTQSRQELRVVRRVLQLEDAQVVRVSRQGVVLNALPKGISVTDLEPAALLSGQTVSGRDNNLVFAAAPVQLTPAERQRLKVAGAFAIVLTRQIGDLGPSWSYFILAGGVALLIAALVAWQMSRRMARPLIEVMEVTGRIAAGDLESRVPVRSGEYSEFSSLGRSVNEMAQSLEDSRSRERHLLLSISHDLRTPLTSIRGFAEAITDGALEDSAHAADVIISESQRLERLVEDLLNLTKLEARQLSIRVRPTDLAEVVGTTIEGFRPLAENSGVTLVLDAPADDAAPVATDPDRMAQLLANLIENALTFARTTVTISLRKSGEVEPPGSQTITVQDDGPGIAPGDLPRVFERFYQADRGPNRQIGSGLGLAIVAELAAALGATVRAESPLQADGGSRFVLTVAGSAA